jgi:hypothetical protein
VIRKLLAAARSDNATFALAAMCVVVGMKMVEKVLTERADRLSELDAAIAERRAELEQMHLNLVAKVETYPAPADIDPLGRGQADSDELAAV